MNNNKVPRTGESPASKQALENKQNGKSQPGTTLEKQQRGKDSVSWDNPSKTADKECLEEIAILLEEWPEQMVNTVLVEGHRRVPTDGNQADDHPGEQESCSRIRQTGCHDVTRRPDEAKEPTDKLGIIRNNLNTFAQF